jgi:serine/threonine-protein kinase
VFELTEADTFLIGRSKKAHLRLDVTADLRISRMHAVIEFRPPKCLVSDLDSRNGTWVNDRKIEKTELSSGDQIRIGRTRIEFEIVEPRDVSEAAEPTTSAECGGPDVDATAKAKAKTLFDRISPAAHPPRPHCASCGCDLSSALTPKTEPAIMRLCGACAAKERQADLPFSRIGDFQVVDVLGQGGMGTVYRAVHRETGLVAAAKVMSSQLEWDDMAARLFEREMGVVSQARHVNLVRYVGQGRVGNTPYYLTEYVPGGDLRAVVTEKLRSPMPPKIGVFISLQILSGLFQLHERGFIHRDIKPSNCLVDRPINQPGLTVKIADYGLAKSYETAGHSVYDFTQAGQILGSFAFMPPEQITQYRYLTPQADVYSAGATLYYLLTGAYTVDFHEHDDTSGGGHRHPLEIILEEPSVPIQRLRPDVPDALAAVIDRAVVKERDRRFKDAAQFGLALWQSAVKLGWVRTK